MPAPIAAAALVAARLAAKQAGKKIAKNSIKKGTKSTKGQGISTGKAKVDAAKRNPSKQYEAPVKGSGKPKYQNVTKENRLNTKKRTVDITTSVKKNLVGKKVTNQEKRAIGNKAENIAKQIDREYKIQKGVRTAKPTTPKVPVKRSK